MKSILLFASILILFSCANPNPKEEQKFKPAADYFPKEKAQVLVVGTFHFDYPGLDASVTADEDKIDVLQEPKKSEVTELVNYIKKFKPNKIAIEAFPNWEATSKLKQYKAGAYQDQRDERFQIAMRLANELQLDTLYAIDSDNLVDNFEKTYPEFTNELFKDFDFKSDDPYNELTFNWYNAQDKLTSKTRLLGYFKHINSKETHQYTYGAYLVGDFKLDDHRGADILSIWWYNRNLRIFRKLQQITENANDRILMVFGNGHAAVLRQLIEASPEYDFVEFDSL